MFYLLVMRGPEEIPGEQFHIGERIDLPAQAFDDFHQKRFEIV